jgi:hypothetical protein
MKYLCIPPLLLKALNIGIEWRNTNLFIYKHFDKLTKSRIAKFEILIEELPKCHTKDNNFYEILHKIIVKKKSFSIIVDLEGMLDYFDIVTEDLVVSRKVKSEHYSDV